MAVFDQKEQRLVVRVVYDGPAHAGKTTNLQQLCQYFTRTRRSDLVSYGDVAGRTLFFEWLQLDGGLVGGYPLRCQLVSVPGQAVMDHRRRPIVEAADAVVLVTDSQPTSMDIARRMLADLSLTLPLVVQANKQDLPGALPPKEVLSALSLPPSTPVVGTRVVDGAGVRETVVLAIRAAANRAQKLLLSGGVRGFGEEVEGHEQLYRRLQLVPEPDPLLRTEHVLSRLSGASGPPAPSVPKPEPERAPQPAFSSATPAPADSSEALPSPDVAVGHVWPAILGREILREVAAHAAVLQPNLTGKQGMDDGSGTSDVVIMRAGPWCLKTSSRRRFTEHDLARNSMLQLARRKITLKDLLVPRTVLCLKESRDEFWLWTVTPWLGTLRGWMSTAVAESDEAALELALSAFADAAVESLCLAVKTGTSLDVHPSNFALHGGRVVYVDDDIWAGSNAPAAGHALLRRVDEYAAFPGAVRAYAQAVETALLVKLSGDDLRALGLADGLEAVVMHTEPGRRAKDQLLRALAGRAIPWSPPASGGD